MSRSFINSPVLAKFAKQKTMEVPPLRGETKVVVSELETEEDIEMSSEVKKEEKFEYPRSLMARAMHASGRFQQYRCRLGLVTPLNSTVTSGAVNQLVVCYAVGTLTEFSSGFAILFDEFFIHSMRIRYQPRARYAPQYLGTAALAGPSSVGVVVASLFHGAATYGTPGAAVDNATHTIGHTGDPWEHVWKNNESPKSTVVVNGSSGSTTPSQGWCLTAATPTASYTGQVQIIGMANTAYVVASLLGDLVVDYDVSFRNRA
jgi:hypothetical protein